MSLIDFIEIHEELVLMNAEILKINVFDGKHPNEIDKHSYLLWEWDCDKCIDLLEGHCSQNTLACAGLTKNPKNFLITHLHSRTARIARLERMRKFLRTYYLSVDTSVPALSTNASVNSIIQEIRGREIGLKKRRTAALNNYLYWQNLRIPCYNPLPHAPELID